ncbi:MAG: orotidine-5'-phosphate decarboxylase [Pirellulaceae bacterium]|jgi:orotidine-5'-phosphate decarboxylase
MADNFADTLTAAIKKKQNPVLVGLDPRADNLPTGLLTGSSPDLIADAYRRFCTEVIDVISPLVAIVKPQAAFFEALGPLGMRALSDTINYAREKGLLVLLDGKRNDIGSTATAYAEGYLGKRPESIWGCDALTVNPYLGDDSLRPFVDVAKERGAGLFVLVKTSNPGGKTFQDLQFVDTSDSAEGDSGAPKMLYQRVGELVESLAVETLGESGYGAVGAVVGATYPTQAVELREQMPHTWFLVPGFGAQGGSAADVAGAFDENGLGAIINSSRGIIFAHLREPYAEKYGDGNWQNAVDAATRDMISELRTETPAGKLSGN